MDTGGRSLPGHMALGTPIGNFNRNSSLLNTERRERMCAEAGSRGQAAELAGIDMQWGCCLRMKSLFAVSDIQAANMHDAPPAGSS